MGLAVWNRPPNLIFAVAVGAYLAWHCRKWLTPYLLGMAFPLAGMLLYSQYFLGSVDTFGQAQSFTHFDGNIGAGLLGILVSPNRGLFVFSPVFLLSLIGLAWVIVYELVPFDFSWASFTQARASGRIVILPMSGHLAGSVGNLVADVSAKFLRYSALAACLVWLIAGPSRMSWRARALLVTACTAVVVAALQGVHLLQASRHCDITNVLIAGVAAAITVVMLRGIRDFYRASPRVVENLLTMRLIEGKSFDKNALSSLRRSRSSASRMATVPTDPRD